jgi:hypothetical protein
MRAAGWLGLRHLRVLLVHNNPVACEGSVGSVRVMDDLAARVRGGGGRARCDWKFVGTAGEEGQLLDVELDVEPTCSFESQFDNVHKELNSAAAVIAAAAHRGGAHNAQYDVLPRKVGDFARGINQLRDRGVTRGFRCGRRGEGRLRWSTQPP